jgi:predicted esterase
VFLYHGMQDEFLPYRQAVQLRKDWCARGQRIAFEAFLGDHISTFLAGQVDAQAYLADRFAGRRAPSSC